MSTSTLSVDVFVTPIRPYAGDAPQGPGDAPTWAPMSSTLIAGENKAILIENMMWTEVCQSDDVQLAVKTILAVEPASRRDWFESHNTNNYPTYGGH
jgi:hypothetical protein